jgi:pyrroloquinoline quinone (PQQ) biosynthesis protein C
MTKQDAMEELGCDTLKELAEALGVTPSAISQWPDPLPDHAVRRVESRLYRRVRRVKYR